MEPYYYSKMNKNQQNIYHFMKIGLSNMESSFTVPQVDSRELQDIFFKLRLDCPEIFYATGYHYRIYRDAVNVEIIPDYLFDKKKVKDHQNAMKARIEKLLRPTSSMTEWEKELYIHDFICTNVRYDKLKKPYSHEIIGPLGHGVGVCEGIAKTVKVLCDALGIWCMIAISEANPDKNIKYRHAWNVIKMGGEYYHVDATFNNTLGRDGIIRYDYFNLSDKHIFRDHEPVVYKIPECNNGNHFYYREKKLSFTKIEEVSKRATQAMRKGKPLIFHWRRDHLSREVIAELFTLLEETAQKKGKHVKISLNWLQEVFCVTFIEEETGEKILVEVANEGETTDG